MTVRGREIETGKGLEANGTVESRHGAFTRPGVSLRQPSVLRLFSKLNSNSQDRIMFAGHAPALQALDFLQVAV